MTNYNVCRLKFGEKSYYRQFLSVTGQFDDFDLPHRPVP